MDGWVLFRLLLTAGTLFFSMKLLHISSYIGVLFLFLSNLMVAVNCVFLLANHYGQSDLLYQIASAIAIFMQFAAVYALWKAAASEKTPIK